MLFDAIAQYDGCNCAGCGQSQYEGMGMVVRRADGKYDVVMVCAGCLFKAVIGEAAWNKALSKTDPPKPTPAKAIKPRWFGV
jgi:hypothetical protein